MTVYRDEPATPEQLTGALSALGLYNGTGSAAEHAAEARRLGLKVYRMQLANALLGAAQTEALLCEQLGVPAGKAAVAHHEQLRTAGVMNPGSDLPDPGKLVQFLRWQTLRVAGPLRDIAADPATGPIPLAAAHAVDGLQKLLGVIGGPAVNVETVLSALDELAAARECLQTAIVNIEILTSMLDSVAGALRSDS